MIEVLEETSSSGTSAKVVGGKQEVVITAQAAEHHPARRSACDNRMIKAYTSPAGFWVKHSKGNIFVVDYNRAVELAIFHAKRS